MKKLTALLLLICLCASPLNAQKVFVRLYTNYSPKPEKGFLAGTTDSSVIILKDTVRKEFPATSITYLKTKRTAGHSILIGSIIGATTLGIYGAASGEQKINDTTLDGTLHDVFTYSPGEGFVAGFLLGAATGAAVGALAYAINKHQAFAINGRLENFTQLKPAIDKLLQSY